MKRNIYLNMKNLEDAKEIISRLWNKKRTLPEEIRVAESLGRVTSEPVFARLSAPTYHSSAMDGIAVRAEDTYGTTEKKPKMLKIGEDAIWINTGQAIPDSFNAVIMVEKVHQLDDKSLEIRSSAYPWQNIRKVGEDIVATQMLLPHNHIIRAYDLGALISAGVFSVKVRKKPAVRIIPTGSELVNHRNLNNPDQIKTGQIIESNSVTLAGLVMECHGIPLVNDIVLDQEQDIRTALEMAVESEADVIIINAGSSAGSKDYTAGIIGEIGEVLVHGVAMMPGKPTIIGSIKDKPVIGIPGYMVSAVLSFEQLVRPLLFSLQAIKAPETGSISVKPSRDIPSKLGTEEFLRVNIGKVNEKLIATPLPRAAGSITTLTRAEGIIRIPALSDGVSQDEEVQAELIVAREDLENTIVIIGSHDITLDIIGDEIRRMRNNIRVSSGNVGSLGGLIALRKGICHLAGAHLLDTVTGEYNISYIRKHLKGMKVSVFNLVQREQGLIVRKNNPKGIMEIKDLARDEVTFINRQPGSGTRILFDYNLEKAGITSNRINGYEHEEFTHMAVAVDVLSGAADCGMGIYAAAKALDLDFIPIVKEQYDLIILSSSLVNENLQLLLETIGTEEFRSRVFELGGYDPSKSGELWMELDS
jgi:molybdenum cofactor synthesis domain-containing protein